MSEPAMFDELGGEPVLRPLIDRFVDQLFADPMIGFLFRGVSKARIKEKEYELAAEHLGGGVTYTGRPLRQAHARHLIMGGQFDRRLHILRTTLAEAGVPEHIQAHWLAHTERLRTEVTQDPSGMCAPDPSSRQR